MTVARRSRRLRRFAQVPSFRLIPREERFFDLFVEDAANVLDGARQLEAMLEELKCQRRPK